MPRKQELKKIGGGVFGTLGLSGLAGTCGLACGSAILPLGSLLGAVGLASAIPVIHSLRIPLTIGAVVLAAWTIHKTIKTDNSRNVAVVSVLLTVIITTSVVLNFYRPQ